MTEEPHWELCTKLSLSPVSIEVRVTKRAFFFLLFIPCSVCEFVVVCNPITSSIFDPGCMFLDMSCLVSQRKTLMSTWFNIKGRVPESRARCQRGNFIPINKNLQMLNISCTLCIKRRGHDVQNSSAHFTKMQILVVLSRYNSRFYCLHHTQSGVIFSSHLALIFFTANLFCVSSFKTLCFYSWLQVMWMKWKGKREIKENRGGFLAFGCN